MDGSGPGVGSPLAAKPSAASTPAKASTNEQANFEALVAQLEDAAREWGVRPDSAENRFISAQMGATRWLGQLGLGAVASLEAISKQSREAAELELGRAREITKAVQAALAQARNVVLAVQVEKEVVTDRVVREMFPQCLEKLQGALVVREKEWGERRWFRTCAMAGLLTLGVFLGGFAAKAWQDSQALSAWSYCAEHAQVKADHVYCEVTGLIAAR